MIYTRTLRLADTDAAGVIYFATLLAICHEAYEFMLEKKGLPLQTFLENSELILPIAHAEIDFFAPLKCNDYLKIALQMKGLNDYSFECHYQVWREDELNPPSRPSAKALTRHFCIDRLTRQKMILPDKLIRLFDNSH